MANGELAHDEHFLLLSQCLHKSSPSKASGSVFIWERVIAACLPFTKCRPNLMPLKKTTFSSLLKNYMFIKLLIFSIFLQKCFGRRLQQMCCMWERVSKSLTRWLFWYFLFLSLFLICYLLIHPNLQQTKYSTAEDIENISATYG